MAQRLGVVGLEALDVVGRQAGELEGADHAPDVQRRGVGEDVALGERPRLGVAVAHAGDAVVEQAAFGLSRSRRRWAYASIWTLPTCSTMPIEAIASKRSPSSSRQSWTRILPGSRRGSGYRSGVPVGATARDRLPTCLPSGGHIPYQGLMPFSRVNAQAFTIPPPWGSGYINHPQISRRAP